MKIALVGTGNLLEALLVGAIKADVPKDWLMCSTRTAERAAELGKRHDVACTPSNAAAAQDAHLVVVGCPPDALDEVLAEIAPELRPGAVVAVATVPATLAELESALPDGTAVVRLMPSVAARVGHGICGISRGHHVSDDQAALVAAFAEPMGEVVWLDEDGLSMLGSLAGSGPAYLAALFQAMADGGAELGIHPCEAQRLVLATARGTVALLETGLTATEIGDAVGHPGGSTQRSLAHLRASGAFAAVTRAVTGAVTGAGEATT